MALDMTGVYLTQIVRVKFTVAEDGPLLTKTLVGRAKNADELMRAFDEAHPEVLNVEMISGYGIHDGEWVAI